MRNKKMVANEEVIRLRGRGRIRVDTEVELGKV